MSNTMPRRPASRRLAAVPADASGLETLAETASQLGRGLADVHKLAIDYVLSRATTLRLNPAAELCVGSAEAFLYSLDGEDLAAADGRRAAYLLGLAESHLVAVITILRAVTAP